MKKIRAAILGQGRSGRDIHAHLMQKMPEQYEIVAVADLEPDRCAQAEAELKCTAYRDYRKLLQRDDLDLVVNALPSHLHVPGTQAVLEAGRNVLCDKPLANRAKDVDRLIALARRKKRLFAIFQQSRFAPYFREVRRVIDSGVIGRVVMVKIAFNGFGRRWDWQTLQKCMGGNLLNTGPHPLDQALQLFGAERTPKVFCLMDRVNTRGDAEDHVKLILHGKGCPTIDLEISSCCAYPLYTYQVYGSLGGLTGTTTHLEWKHFKPEEAPKRKLVPGPMPGRAYCSEQLQWHTGSWDAAEDESKGLFDYMGTRLYGNLHAALTEGAPLVVTPKQVCQQIAVIEECHRQCPLARMIPLRRDH